MVSSLVSIIIPCYNAASYVAEAIQSALGQTYAYKEVIVIDDGSSDGSLEVIRSFGDAIHWQTGPNRGGCAARNRGLELARGEFIQFLDADDILLPNKIEQQMSLSKNNPSELVMCDHLETAQNPSEAKLIDCDPRGQSAPRWIVQTERLGVSAPLHRCESLRAIGGFDEELAASQEYDLHLRLVLAGARVQHLREPLWVVRKHPGSVCSDIMRVTRQHVRILRRAFEIACEKLHGEELEDAKKALAEACIRDARRCLQNSDRILAIQFLKLAADFHRTKGLGFYRYNRVAYAIAKMWGPTTAEKIVAFKRRRTGYYQKSPLSFINRK
jgi:glycosyltransferase involved in cell wall biosynthesis